MWAPVVVILIAVAFDLVMTARWMREMRALSDQTDRLIERYLRAKAGEP